MTDTGDPAQFSVSGTDLTLRKSAYYNINYNIQLSGDNSGLRSDVRALIYADTGAGFTELYGFEAWAFVRNTDPGTAALLNHVGRPVYLPYGTQLRFQLNMVTPATGVTPVVNITDVFINVAAVADAIGDKLAIMPVASPEGGTNYVGLMCTEMPEARFEDVVHLALTSDATRYAIDPTFLTVCEPDTIQVVGIVPSRPLIVGARVVRDTLIVEKTGDTNCHVTVKLSGIRRDRYGIRFPQYGYQEMQHNNQFWNSAFQMPESS